MTKHVSEFGSDGERETKSYFQAILRASDSVKSISWARETSDNPAADDRSLVDRGFRKTATRDDD